MRLALIGLGFMLASLAPGHRMALAQKPSPWSDLRCAETPMAAEGISRCQARNPTSGRATVRGQAAEYLARSGPAGSASNGRELILWLLWFHDDWVYQPYAPELSESIIRAHIQPSLTAGASGWSARQGFGTTVFLTFEAKGRQCVGFDHGGPIGKPAGADVAGHAWLLRGIVCERRATAFEQGDVEELLRNVRLSKGGYVDAFGGRWGEAASPSTEAPPAVAAVAPGREMAAPLALSWDDVVRLASGTLTFAGEGRGGAVLSFRIPDAGLRCTGFFRQLTGGPGTTEQPAGTWAVSCPGGDAASGTWRAETPASGSGEGQDSLGRRVTIRYGS